MASMKDEVRSEYQDLRDRFRGTSYEDFRRGEWFATFVRWLLENYAKQVDAEYIRRKYPGVAPANQAKKAISLASKYNGIAGGLSASAITALQLSSLAPKRLSRYLLPPVQSWPTLHFPPEHSYVLRTTCR